MGGEAKWVVGQLLCQSCVQFECWINDWFLPTFIFAPLATSIVNLINKYIPYSIVFRNPTSTYTSQNRRGESAHDNGGSLTVQEGTSFAATVAQWSPSQVIQLSLHPGIFVSRWYIMIRHPSTSSLILWCAIVFLLSFSCWTQGLILRVALVHPA